MLPLFGMLTARAQQEPLYSQYMNQLLSINPAYAGAKGVLNASLLWREQWLSYGELHPSTKTLFAHSPMDNMNMGVGGSIVMDKFAFMSNTSIFGDYSYSIFYPNEKSLSFGLNAGVEIFSALLSQANQSDVYDPLLEDIENKIMPNFGVGMYYSTPNYYIGLSIPRLMWNSMSAKNVESTTISREQMHVYFMGGYVFDVSRIIKFKPYFMLRATPNAPLSIDLTGQFVFVDKLWVGGTYSVGNAIGAMAQVKATDQLSIGYAFEYTLSEINSNTHEIMLSFDFSFGRGRVRSPRYF